MNSIEVGKPFPVPVNTDRDFCTMELWSNGPVVIINFNDMTAKERRMFKESFKRYAYYEPIDTDAPLSVWMFEFSKPFGIIEVNFDARLPPKKIIDEYLEKENGHIKNLWQFFLLDRGIVQAIKSVGLHPEAIKLFHKTIKKQLSKNYTAEQYNSALTLLNMSSSEENMKYGVIFDLRKKNV